MPSVPRRPKRGFAFPRRNPLVCAPRRMNSGHISPALLKRRRARRDMFGWVISRPCPLAATKCGFRHTTTTPATRSCSTCAAWSSRTPLQPKALSQMECLPSRGQPHPELAAETHMHLGTSPRSRLLLPMGHLFLGIGQTLPFCSFRAGAQDRHKPSSLLQARCPSAPTATLRAPATMCRRPRPSGKASGPCMLCTTTLRLAFLP